MNTCHPMCITYIITPTDVCAVNGYWKPWAEWVECSVSCGGGDQTRARQCQMPLYGGEACDGPTDETRPCNPDPCPGNVGQHTYIILSSVDVVICILPACINTFSHSFHHFSTYSLSPIRADRVSRCMQNLGFLITWLASIKVTYVEHRLPLRMIESSILG